MNFYKISLSNSRLFYAMLQTHVFKQINNNCIHQKIMKQ